MTRILFVIAVILICSSLCFAQQEADTAFIGVIENPTYEAGSGPVVMIDEAHHNFHTAEGRFLPFAELLRRDGYTVRRYAARFTLDSLKTGDILVISNALNERNVEDWSLPTPSAFDAEEIEAVRQWVEGGGALFLIADHMPFPGAAQDLAGAFGVMLNNGFALDTLKRSPDFFRRSDGTLREHTITGFADDPHRIDSVVTFTGQAFQVDNKAFEPLLIFDSGYVSLMPVEAWEFDSTTTIAPIEGWFQGGVLEFGKGRVAVFGEAAEFTAQIAGEERMKFGMNSPYAGQNLPFLLNIFRWLSRHGQ
ncbi:MAG: DUF4350 domain-containing protein [Candidatus Zixiibacteriota bacterium]